MTEREVINELHRIKKQLEVSQGGDLISRKTLLDRLTESFQNINYHPDFGDPAVGMEKELFNEFLYDMVKLVEEQPTAYDVDRVIEKLEATACGEWGYPSVMEFDDVVGIVKAGGR